jgi:chromosome segregation ATPase
MGCKPLARVLLLGSLAPLVGCLGPQDPGTRYQRQAPWAEELGAAKPKPEEESQVEDTLLEQLQETTAKLEVSQSEAEGLRTQVVSLTETVGTLTRDNESLQELLGSLETGHELAQREVVQFEEEIQDLHRQQRELFEDVLAERIQKIRMERELILARIAEAEREEDG